MTHAPARTPNPQNTPRPARIQRHARHRTPQPCASTPPAAKAGGSLSAPHTRLRSREHQGAAALAALILAAAVALGITHPQGSAALAAQTTAMLGHPAAPVFPAAPAADPHTLALSAAHMHATATEQQATRRLVRARQARAQRRAEAKAAARAAARAAELAAKAKPAVPHTVRPASTPAAASSSYGLVLSYSQLEQVWVQAGGPATAEAQAATVATCESGGRADAYNPSGATGLWQILGQVVPGNLDDPLVNAENAVSKYHASGDTFAQWVCQP